MFVEEELFLLLLFLKTYLIILGAIFNVKPGIMYDNFFIPAFHIILVTSIHPIVPHQLLLTAQFSPLSSVLINTISVLKIEFIILFVKLKCKRPFRSFGPNVSPRERGRLSCLGYPQR